MRGSPPRRDQRIHESLGARQGQRFVVLEPCKYDIIGDAWIEHLLGLLPKQLLLRPVGIVDDEPGDLREACVRERTCGVDPENELADDRVLGQRGKLLRLRPIAADASQQRFEGSRRDIGGDSIGIAAATIAAATAMPARR